MSKNIFFTSDLHFHHASILKFCPKTRPFSSVEEMNEKLIEAWNARVQPGDIVYNLGDVTWGKLDETVSVLCRLNGQHHLIRGNHDGKMFDTEVVRKCFAWIGDYKFIKIGGKEIALFHFPIESWRNMQHGSWHLFGHLHGNTSHDAVKEMKGRMDVGIDTRTDYSPWAWEEVKEKLCP